MKLELGDKETKELLLEAIERKFPGMFNKVELSDFSSYGERGTTEFSRVKPETDAPPAISEGAAEAIAKMSKVTA